MPQRMLAFTLLELLSTLAIIAILTSIALPAYSAFIKRQTTITLLTQLNADLQFARGTAITHHTAVSLCSGSSSCRASHEWTQQLLIFADNNLNGSLDSGEKLLKVAELPTSHSWKWSNFRQQPYMTYIPNGMTNSLNGTFTLCQNTQALASLTLNRAGRVRQVLFKEPSACPP